MVFEILEMGGCGGVKSSGNTAFELSLALKTSGNTAFELNQALKTSGNTAFEFIKRCVS